MKKLHEIYEKYHTFLKGNPSVFFSPGRVNLIGEHIDYLGGNVFPAAIELGTYALVTKREDKKFKCFSVNFPQSKTKIIEHPVKGYDKSLGWANFVAGMIDALIDDDVPFGLNILIYGNLPNGAGLSSSASLEVLIGEILNDYYHLGVSRIDMVQIAQNVENEFVGLKCGIMDQFAVGMSKKDTAILLNTNTLDHDFVPLELRDYVLLIANTNKKRSLSDSKYNERRAECDAALAILKKEYVSAENLCDLEPEELDIIQKVLDEPILYKRVKHAITEQYRTNKALEVLKAGDIKAFGELMNQSHQSLKDDFKVSCYELDVLSKTLQDSGAIGARMTGAGFGGCTVSLVPKKDLDQVMKNVADIYNNKTDYQVDFYVSTPSDGTKKLLEELK
jgi:galactokinase